MKKNTPENFWAKVDKGEGCWTWNAYRDAKNYGKARWAGKNILAHRLAWVLANGEIPDGMLVLHRCDNPPCVRPDHLFLGSHLDNMLDMVAKGRYHQPPRSPATEKKRQREALLAAHPELKQFGEKHPLAKLTAEKVREMRALKEQGATFQELADRFGVSKRAAVLAVKGLTWAQV